MRKAHKFTDPQSKWLKRIAKQLKNETVVDRVSFDTGQFKPDGDFAGQLETLLRELAGKVWKDAG